jgi:hypothetical protein
MTTAGSLALQVPLPNGKDTLVGLGGKNIERVTYEKVADGPVRAICRLRYTNWKVAEGLAPVSVTEEIQIWGGQFFYESKVTVNGATAGAKLVTGIVTMHNEEFHAISAAAFKGIYTYGLQSENKDKLGMAIVMQATPVTDTTAKPNTDIQNTYFIKTNIINNKPVIFSFYAGWEKSDNRFTTEEGFRTFLLNEMRTRATNHKL